MEIKQINEILKNVFNYPSSKGYTKVLDEKPSTYHEEKYQGTEDTRIEIWDLHQDNLLVKLDYTTDSYGDNERLTNIQFVKPITKSVTDYESI